MWYRLATRAPILLLSNPVISGFWVGDKFIDYGETLYKSQWFRLLRLTHKKINSQEELNNFLNNAKFEIVDDKYTYIPSEYYREKKFSIPFDFYVGNNLIKKHSVFNIKELTKLFYTHSKKITTQEELNNFLNNAKFEIVDGKKTYIPSLKSVDKKLKIPFDFYVGNELISEGDIYSPTKLWKDILNCNRISTQSALEEFLYDSKKFEIIDGKYTYIPHVNRTSRLKIPFDFYIENELISEGDIYNLRTLGALLRTDLPKINTQEKLNQYLYNAKFEIVDGKKTYLRNTWSDSKNLSPPFDFFVNTELISKDKNYTLNYLIKKLHTTSDLIGAQSKLDNFLSNIATFKKDNNGNLIYLFRKNSFREKMFNNKIQMENHNIVVESQKSIRISNPRLTERILRLDFAFVKNEKILLAIEINGGQHYGFVDFGNNRTYEDWQAGLQRDIEKINYCHSNNIPLLIFHHLLPEKYFQTIIDNLNNNPHIFDNYIPQPVINNNVADVSLKFIKRQIYSHVYPVFNGTITFDDDMSKKRYIKDTLILIAKLLGIYEGGIDKTDYIKAFDKNIDLTKNYNICLDIYNHLYPDYLLDFDSKITYSELSKQPIIQKSKAIEQDPSDL